MRKQNNPTDAVSIRFWRSWFVVCIITYVCEKNNRLACYNFENNRDTYRLPCYCYIQLVIPRKMSKTLKNDKLKISLKFVVWGNVENLFSKREIKKEAAEATSFSICDTFVQNLALICEHLYMFNLTDYSAARGGCASFPSCAARCWGSFCADGWTWE